MPWYRSVALIDQGRRCLSRLARLAAELGPAPKRQPAIRSVSLGLWAGDIRESRHEWSRRRRPINGRQRLIKELAARYHLNAGRENSSGFRPDGRLSVIILVGHSGSLWRRRLQLQLQLEFCVRVTCCFDSRVRDHFLLGDSPSRLYGPDRSLQWAAAGAKLDKVRPRRHALAVSSTAGPPKAGRRQNVD